MLADIAADMVTGLDLGEGDYDGGGFLPQGRKTASSLPAIHNQSSSPALVRTGMGRRGSENIMDLEYDPSNMDLKAQARQQTRSRFPSMTVPTLKKQEKKDPLMDFHERYNKAQQEHKKSQDAEKRRNQLRDHDEEKSLCSMGSFFDFLTKSGAADELMDDEMSEDGLGLTGGMSRVGSMHSMASAASHFLGLFGDDEEEIAKLSGSKPAGDARRPENRSSLKPARKAEDPTLQAAVQQSKSVKGNKVHMRGKKAAANGDWKKAVAYYHIALVKQRNYYGEDHIITSNTLNDLGLALMHMGEHFGALTALEEALQIRQEALGAGAEEVAETTSNIWKVLKVSQENGG